MANHMMSHKGISIHAASLPTRKKISSDIFDFENRFAGIGINSLTILKNILDEKGGSSRSTQILMHARTREVAEGTGAIHVVPAGSYQPQEISYDKTRSQEKFDAHNRDLTNTILREFEEEIWGAREFDELYNANLVTNYLKKDKEVYYLGLGIEPFNTKIEVLSVMVIDYTENTETDLQAFKNSIVKQYEGTIEMHKLTEEIILQFEKNPRATPACQQIMKIIRTLMQDTVYPK